MYFRGIRPGLIEAGVPVYPNAAAVGYFRGIRPGLIEARRLTDDAIVDTGISGASAPASLKLSKELFWLKDNYRISGASAPASLKRNQGSGQEGQGDVFPGHPPRPH